ncbi:MAG TPA: hypothetical protein VMU02_11460 [bacterium]|nr:hypothetical protein [bacterium]
MKPRAALSLSLSASAFQHYILRPAILIWVVLAAVMICLGLYDIYAPPGKSPVARLFKHRVNLATEQWKATEEVLKTLPPVRTVLVDTDNRPFFYLLRYRLYPTWVVTERELASWKRSPSDSIDATVIYRKGTVRIEGAKSP